ncbi:MAG: SGNH/GDSL hydrolase family protein [Hyphomicrobiales bacterium]|nr:SGNH/GDSL hydrolase family protein [Hyphomicrobiales bacterium]MDE2115632.1 SGNH/GDSL hydrolase family protein [Hyphomicrobiales bacterium]
MVYRMAFPKAALNGAFVFGLIFAPGPCLAQVTKMSAACEVPSADIGNSQSLVRLTAKLQHGDNIRILAIGSSSTYGLGATSRSKNYPSDLRGILSAALKNVKVEVVNRGVSGEVAATTAERIRSEVAIDPPDLVLWQLGTNDALQRVPPDEFESTVINTLEWLKENHVDVALIGMQYTAPLARDENYRAIRNVLQKVTSKYNILYVHRYKAMQYMANAHKNLKMLANDNFHLNDQGYECMAEHVARAVVASTFGKRFRPIESEKSKLNE